MSVTNRVMVCSVSLVVQLSSYGSVDSNAAQVLQSPICQHFFVVCPRNLASTSATWHVALGTHTEEKIHVKHEKPPQVTDVPPQTTETPETPLFQSEDENYTKDPDSDPQEHISDACTWGA